MKNYKYFLAQLLMVKRMLTFVFDPIRVAITNSILALKDDADALQLMTDSIDVKVSNYKKALSGITAAKRNARTDLALKSFSIMSSVRSYALKNDMQELAAQMDVTLNELKKMAYQPLSLKIQQAIEVVDPIVASLTDYNVTAVSFSAWETSWQTMKDLLNATELAIKNRKTLGTVIKGDMESILNFLDNEMQPLVANFVNTFPEYFQGWYENKKIIHTGIHHNRLNATVVNEIGEPQYGMTVRVDSVVDPDTGKTYHAVSGITDVGGKVTVEEFFPGMRTVTVSGTGIVTQTFPAVEFTKAKGIDKTFTVQPSFDLPEPTTEEVKATVIK